MRTALLAAIVAIMPAACFGQSPAGVDLAATAQESAAAAKQSLTTLAQLAKGDSNAVRLGFTAPGDADNAELGTPLTDFLVQLDELRTWKPGSDPMRLLKPTGLVIYPVSVGGALRSSITLKKQNSEWKAVAFGAPGQTQAVGRVRASVTATERVSGPQTFQVRIPAFNLTFVAHLSGNTLMLTPTVDTPAYGLAAGTTVAAETLFTRLQPEAERDQGLPR
jgi:hypothetical protein